MGADMITATIAAPADREKPFDFEAGRRLIREITDTDLFELDDPESQLEGVIEGFDPSTHLDVNGDPTLAALQAFGEAVINNLEYAFDEDSREIDFREIAGYRLYISGGLSHGDAPTDAADAIWNAYLLPDSVLQAIGFVPDTSKPLSWANRGSHGIETDTDAIDAIALGLGTRPEWSGADELEWIADVIGKVRQHPGDQDPVEYVEAFASDRGADPAQDQVLLNYINEGALPDDEDENDDEEDEDQ